MLFSFSFIRIYSRVISAFWIKTGDWKFFDLEFLIIVIFIKATEKPLKSPGRG